jgi:predicted  nucleic acid-binding Zn-ribbon protein
VTDPLRDLLAVQQLDTAMDQARHQHANLPERAALAGAEGRQRRIQGALAEVARRRQDLADREARLERMIRELDARSDDLAARLPRTMVVREAEALIAEQRSIRQRRSDVEDDELTLLEEEDNLDSEEAGQRADLAEAEASVGAGREALAAAEATIDAQLADLDARRGAAAEPVPRELLARYEALRQRLGGVAVAELIDGRCTGCHLVLASAALERIMSAPPDAVVECEECGRLLVR